ncbi:hypothetical protein [Celerinatantimonas sp. MCCC 1A17872]|uniref:hypothetical protein n=1 Tax=Celerinatantimonas sp. MCCC 1A17872 TaxID=3177514 RepID=UPI0038BEC77C
MANTAAVDDSGESIWDKVIDSVTSVANTAADAYATGAGLKNSANPDDYSTSTTAAQQPDGTPILSSTTTTYLMWGAIALFILVILVILVKVL